HPRRADGGRGGAWDHDPSSDSRGAGSARGPGAGGSPVLVRDLSPPSGAGEVLRRRAASPSPRSEAGDPGVPAQWDLRRPARSPWLATASVAARADRCWIPPRHDARPRRRPPVRRVRGQRSATDRSAARVTAVIKGTQKSEEATMRKLIVANI